MNYKEKLEALQPQLRIWRVYWYEMERPSKKYATDIAADTLFKAKRLWHKQISKKYPSAQFKSAEELNKKNYEFRELQEKFCQEMAVVDKTTSKKTPQQKLREANRIFEQTFSKVKHLKRKDLWLKDDIDVISSEATVMFAGYLEIKGPIEYGYYEIGKDVQNLYNEFKNKIKSIGKFKLPSKIEVKNNSNYKGGIDTNISALGRMVLSQIVVYLNDKNINKKIKLGTYKHKFDAEDGKERDWGFNTDNNWRDKTTTIYYWSKNGRRTDYKTLPEDEVRKYYNNMEITIEEVQR